MTRVTVSRLLGVVLAAAIGFWPIVPPEHVHADHGEHGERHHLVVHRHLAGHSLSHRSADRARAFDDDDAPVATLNMVYSRPDVATTIGHPPVTRVVAPEVPVTVTLHRARERVHRLTHGPPRASASLRAPPVFA